MTTFPMPHRCAALTPATRLTRLAVLMAAALTLTACSRGDFLAQYQALDRQQAMPTAPAANCRPVNTLKAEDLYGTWALSLPDVGESGTLRLSRHPEFSDSLRAHLSHGAVQAIASGDVQDGRFELDESADGRRLTATWSGELVAARCGDEIRGTWNELDTQRSSRFVLTRSSRAAASAQTPSADALPEGVVVHPVPDPGLN